LGFFLVHSFPDIPEAVGIRLVFVDGTVGIGFCWIGSVVTVVVRRIAMPVIGVIVIIVVRIVVPVVREGEISKVAVSVVSVMVASVMAASVTAGSVMAASVTVMAAAG
jgi:hypothetical protein